MVCAFSPPKEAHLHLALSSTPLRISAQIIFTATPLVSFLLFPFSHLFFTSITLSLIALNYDTQVCEEITEQYCCGKGLVEQDPECLRLRSDNQLACLSRCNLGEPVSCDSMYGLWFTAGRKRSSLGGEEVIFHPSIHISFFPL